jgi:hypothetical protein
MRLILALFTLFCSLALMPALADDKYYIADGATQTIDEHGTCKDVTNNAGTEIMVPTKAANEWHSGGNSFLENLPNNVTAAACPPANCNLPWGGTIVHGGNVIAYQNSSESCGGTCTSETRTCTDGTLSGSYTNQSCSVAACASCSSSTINWSSCNAASGSLIHGQTKTVSNAASGYTGTRDLSCDNGTISQSGGSCTANSCGGYSYGGYCYYFGAQEQNCKTVCSGKGGCKLTGIQYANASNARCKILLDNLGDPASGNVSSSTATNYGCANSIVYGGLRINYTGATCSASAFPILGVCACNN